VATGGVTLAQLPHISRAKTIDIGIGSAPPAMTQKVNADNPPIWLATVHPADLPGGSDPPSFGLQAR
jgi:hypothetical protein